MLDNVDMTLEFIKLGVAVGLLAIGYIVGRTGLTQSLSDIKTDISNIKNWIKPSVPTQVVTIPTPVATTQTGVTATVVANPAAVKVG
jgi:hypothetical protein